MPLTAPANPPDPRARLNTLKTPKTASFIDNYFAQGGLAVNSNLAEHSHYDPKPLQNNLSPPGKITIRIPDATTLANLNPGFSYWQPAYDSILLHELGHAFYASRVGSDYTSDPTKMMEWCFNREALASLFVFNYIRERGFTEGEIIVPGPGLPIDLYAVMAAAVVGVNPESFEYEKKLLDAARAKFANNKRYRDACTKWVNGGGLPPEYVPGATTGGGGGGGSGGVPLPFPAYVPIPGGYWANFQLPD